MTAMVKRTASMPQAVQSAKLVIEPLPENGLTSKTPYKQLPGLRIIRRYA